MDDTELLNEPEALSADAGQLPPLGPPAPPAQPQSPSGGVNQQALQQYLQNNPRPSFIGPDGSLIHGQAPRPMMQQGPPDPMQALFQLARSGNRQAQVAFIHTMQRNAELSYSEKIRMQRAQAAIGKISSDPNLEFNEKVNAIRQLQTGIDFDKQREAMAAQKALAQRRQQEAEQMQHQAALMAGIQGMNDAQFADLVAKNTKVMPTGHLLSVLGGKLTITAPVKGEEFDPLKAEAIAQKEVERLSQFSPEVIKGLAGKEEGGQKLLEARLAARNRLIEMKVEGMRAQHEAKHGGRVPETAKDNPQAEYDQIKRNYPGGASTIKDPAIINRVRELRALGAQ